MDHLLVMMNQTTEMKTEMEEMMVLDLDLVAGEGSGLAMGLASVLRVICCELRWRVPIVKMLLLVQSDLKIMSAKV